ncbi:MAG TPA: trehalose-6-phosphate synthase [Propionibacteriaceae bacterium]|nr:trehalose-6-phosphate synthase [Propionibacteriaceae bacterium]
MRAATADSLVVVSRDLPVHTTEHVESLFHRGSTPGNRMNAITSVIHQPRAVWVGGCDPADGKAVQIVHERFTLEAVPVGSGSAPGGEDDFCSRTLWPLYHDIVAHPDFPRPGWDSYQVVNKRFTDRVAAVAKPGATVWILDHHLQLLPAMLRARRPDLRIGLFMDIPFPPMELLYHLPWHREVLEGLLGADLIGFQLARHQQNFIEAAQVAFGYPLHPAGLHLGDRHLRTGTYPVSVDSRSLSQLAALPESVEQAANIRAMLGDPEILLLAFDQLDCTAGIGERLVAFEALIKDKQIDPRNTVLIQIATTADEHSDQRSQMRDDIDRLVGRINGDAARYGHPPVIYVHSPGPDITMAGLYGAADVLLSTPLRDGMSLAAKEYIACRQEDDGAVLLSTLSGAAEQLISAYDINPYDLEASKAGLLRAIQDTPAQRATRMRSLREHVAGNDLSRWAHRFLRDLGSQVRDVPAVTPQKALGQTVLVDPLTAALPAGLRRWPRHLPGSSSPSLS